MLWEHPRARQECRTQDHLEASQEMRSSETAKRSIERKPKAREIAIYVYTPEAVARDVSCNIKFPLADSAVLDSDYRPLWQCARHSLAGLHMSHNLIGVDRSGRLRRRRGAGIAPWHPGAQPR